MAHPETSHSVEIQGLAKAVKFAEIKQYVFSNHKLRKLHTQIAEIIISRFCREPHDGERVREEK